MNKDTVAGAVDTSTNRIEILYSIGCADYIHMALLAERDKLREALSNIAVVGFSEDTDVAKAIAQQVVEQARDALEEIRPADRIVAVNYGYSGYSVLRTHASHGRG